MNKIKSKSVRLILIFLAYCGVAQAQHQQLERLVNPFTGNVGHNQPLISLSGPNGESFPVQISYNSGGIGMNQKSSMVGLGWNITTPQISRGVKGVPDDWNGVSRSIFDSEGSPSSTTKSYYGPVYFADFPTKNSSNDYDTDEMDTYVSQRKLDGNTFVGVNYDNFYVNAPGLGGELSMKLFEYANLINTENTSETYSGTEGTNTTTYYDNQVVPFVKRPILVMKNAKGIDANNKLKDQSLNNWKPEAFSALYPTVSNAYEGNMNSAGQIESGFYIKYFTNGEINDMKGPENYSNFNFIESSKYYPFNRFQEHLIGAIQITTPNGMTYHFSLPEYVYEESSKSYLMSDNGTATDLFSSSSTSGPSTSEPLYATNWKLVAITGADFKDNGTSPGQIDAGDGGYWINFDYGSLYQTKSLNYPAYGLLPDVNAPGGEVDLLQYEHPEFNNQPFQYEQTGSVSSNRFDSYYINKISTSTHHLKFYYSQRDDETGILNAQGKGIPEVKLDKIILVNDASLSTLESYDNAISFNDTKFDLSSVSVNNLSSSGNSSSYASIILGEVFMEYDYSQCQYYYENINTDVTTQSISVDNTDFEKVSSVSAIANSGKLTLTKINRYHKGRESLSAPYIFEYVSNNPNYNPLKKDFWGFYKSDQSGFFGNYTNDVSQTLTDAWMLEKINTPNGSIIELEYESDTYLKVGNNSTNASHDFSSPQRTFLVKSVSYNSSTGTAPNRTMEMDITLDGDLPSSFLGNTYSREAMVFLRYKGNCKTEYEGVSAGYDDLTTYDNSDPILGMGYTSDNLNVAHSVDPSEGKMHYNVLQGSSFSGFQSASNPYRSHLVSLQVISNNVIRVNIKEDEYFSDQYKNQATHNGTVNPDRIYCDQCDGNTGGTDYDFSDTDNFMYGYISVNTPSITYGGGVRVKKASLSGLDNAETFHINYNYGIGYASGEPDRFAHIAYNEELVRENVNYTHDVLTLPKVLQRSVIGSNPLIPQAFVYYSQPQLEYYGNDQWFKTLDYQYQTEFDLIKTEYEDLDPVATYSSTNTKWEVDLYHKTKVIDQTDLFGKIKEITTSTPEGETTTRSYNYKELGSVNEYFTKRVSPFISNNAYGASSSDDAFVTHYYSHLEVKTYGVSSITNTQDDGTSTTTVFDDFDPLVNDFLHISESHNIVGETSEIRKVPAHLSNNLFKSKHTLSTNKNITAVIEKTVDELGLMESEVAFSRSIPYLQIHSTAVNAQVHTSLMDYPIVQTDRINPDSETSNWISQSEVSLLDQNLKNIETYNLQSNIATSSQYDYHNGQLLSQAQNAGYFSNFFESFENVYYDDDANFYFLPSNTKLSSSNAWLVNSSASINAHTGDSYLKLGDQGYISYKLDANTVSTVDYSRETFKSGTTYLLQYWIHEDAYDNLEVQLFFDGHINGTTAYTTNLSFQPNEILANNNGWLLIQQKFDVPDNFDLSQSGDFFEIRLNNEDSEDLLMDDISLRPVDAALQGFIYDDFSGEVTHTLDNTNRYTRYEYDASGRLLRTYIETTTGEELLTETEYHHEKY